MKNIKLEDIISGQCYHVCTDGQESPVIMREEEDYRIAHNYIAICSWITEVEILAYSIMSNHIHAAIVCMNRKKAEQFIRLFKQLYSRYLRNKYDIEDALHKIKDSISIINDIQYLRNCIAYILRNPICAKVCRRIEDYEWSSQSCYFNRDDSKGIPVSALGIREGRRILKTRYDLKKCPLLIDEKQKITGKSFIKYDIVEAIYQNSGRLFLYFLGTCNDTRLEYEMACKPLLKMNDTDLMEIAEKLSISRFNGKSISELSSQNKCSIIKHLYFNNKTSIPQLARVLGLPTKLITSILRN